MGAAGQPLGKQGWVKPVFYFTVIKKAVVVFAKNIAAAFSYALFH